MRIALVNSYFFPDEPGGAERSVRILAEALGAAGHEVLVLCLAADRVSPYVAATVHSEGVTVQRLRVRNAWPPAKVGSVSSLSKLLWHGRDTYNFSAASDVAEVLTRFRPEVVHTNNLSGFSVALWSQIRKLRVPIVHTLRDFYLACPKTTMASAHGESCVEQCSSCRVFSGPRSFATKNVSAVVGISRFMLRRHRELGMFGGAQEHVIYNSYDGIPYSPRTGSSLTVGFIGRVVPEKGVPLLLEAFRGCMAETAGGRLIIAGEGEPGYVESLSRTFDHPRVDFIGKQNPADFFSRIDICVVPSVWSEPLGRVALESLVHGRPVVVTPVGGLPELARGDAGIVAAEISSDALRNAINEMTLRVLADPGAINAAALAQRKSFLPDVVANSYVDVYKSVAEHGY